MSNAMSTEKMQQVQERLAEILSRSATDVEFRTQLISDPRAALSAHLGREVPESAANIRFIDAQGTPTIVLPDANTGELSADDLEAVAGGVAPLIIYAGWVAAGFAAAAIGDALF